LMRNVLLVKLRMWGKLRSLKGSGGAWGSWKMLNLSLRRMQRSLLGVWRRLWKRLAGKVVW